MIFEERFRGIKLDIGRSGCKSVAELEEKLLSLCADETLHTIESIQVTHECYFEIRKLDDCRYERVFL